jgi:hypothetical protein
MTGPRSGRNPVGGQGLVRAPPIGGSGADREAGSARGESWPNRDLK